MKLVPLHLVWIALIALGSPAFAEETVVITPKAHPDFPVALVKTSATKWKLYWPNTTRNSQPTKIA